ncbi:MAG TPA: 2,3,4,5-tetrahydropyridine-2,6-dicarboxylate N-succinyltransferase, partial [Vicinamibacteria bacterium]|nr:2,3,4,5-tetrahydropyridine-2,6-dicarboxylate N-succinyltransferase [Vicinamibacteria bacterium]
MSEGLQPRLERWWSTPPADLGPEARSDFEELLSALEGGGVRAAEPAAEGWRVNEWVKRGILLGFRLGRLVELPAAGPLRFFDKDTVFPRELSVRDGVRVVPGGTAVRRGAYLGPGVVLMPPAYVNVGAFVGEGTMV